TYENETARYLECLGEFAPDYYYVARYDEAIADIDSAAMSIRQSKKGTKFGQWFFLLFCGIPSIIMIIALLTAGLPDVNPIKGHIVATFIICMIGSAVFESALWGFELFSTLIPSAIAGAVITGIFYALFAFSPDAVNFTMLAVLIIGLLYRGYKLIRLEKVDLNKDIQGDEFEYRQLDALYYAYKETGKTLDNVVTKYAELQSGADYTNRSNLTYSGLRWAAVVWMLFVLWYFWTPALSGERSWTTEVIETRAKAGQWVLGTWEFKLNSGTRIVCTVDSIEDGKNIFGTMKIGKQAPVEANGVVHNESDTLPDSFSFHALTGGYNKQNLNVTYNPRTKKPEGYYYDRNSIMHQITFVRTPLNLKNSETPARSTSEKSSKKKKEKSLDTRHQ
ncbi:MAG: hypothetical protein K2K55_06155, partial [Duncaniella sp.]|nr:hypothetical protein [Duncaniella sp.]